MNRKFLFLIIISFLAPCVHAEASNDEQESGYLYLVLSSGESVKFSLDDYPSIQFDGPNMSVQNDRYLISDVAKYTFIDPSKEHFPNDDPFSIVDGILLFPSSLDFKNARLVDINGLEYPIKQISKSEKGEMGIDISSLEPGTYIIHNSGHSLKFIKK